MSTHAFPISHNNTSYLIIDLESIPNIINLNGYVIKCPLDYCIIGHSINFLNVNKLPQKLIDKDPIIYHASHFRPYYYRNSDGLPEHTHPYYNFFPNDPSSHHEIFFLNLRFLLTLQTYFNFNYCIFIMSRAYSPNALAPIRDMLSSMCTIEHFLYCEPCVGALAQYLNQRLTNRNTYHYLVIHIGLYDTEMLYVTYDRKKQTYLHETRCNVKWGTYNSILLLCILMVDYINDETVTSKSTDRFYIYESAKTYLINVNRQQQNPFEIVMSNGKRYILPDMVPYNSILFNAMGPLRKHLEDNNYWSKVTNVVFTGPGSRYIYLMRFVFDHDIPLQNNDNFPIVYRSKPHGSFLGTETLIKQLGTKDRLINKVWQLNTFSDVIHKTINVIHRHHLHYIKVQAIDTGEFEIKMGTSLQYNQVYQITKDLQEFIYSIRIDEIVNFSIVAIPPNYVKFFTEIITMTTPNNNNNATTTTTDTDAFEFENVMYVGIQNEHRTAREQRLKDRENQLAHRRMLHGKGDSSDSDDNVVVEDIQPVRFSERLKRKHMSVDTANKKQRKVFVSKKLIKLMERYDEMVISEFAKEKKERALANKTLRKEYGNVIKHLHMSDDMYKAIETYYYKISSKLVTSDERKTIFDFLNNYMKQEVSAYSIRQFFTNCTHLRYYSASVYRFLLCLSKSPINDNFEQMRHLMYNIFPIIAAPVTNVQQAIKHYSIMVTETYDATANNEVLLVECYQPILNEKLFYYQKYGGDDFHIVLNTLITKRYLDIIKAQAFINAEFLMVILTEYIRVRNVELKFTLQYINKGHPNLIDAIFNKASDNFAIRNYIQTHYSPQNKPINDVSQIKISTGEFFSGWLLRFIHQKLKVNDKLYTTNVDEIRNRIQNDVVVDDAINEETLDLHPNDPLQQNIYVRKLMTELQEVKDKATDENAEETEQTIRELHKKINSLVKQLKEEERKQATINQQFQLDKEHQAKEEEKKRVMQQQLFDKARKTEKKKQLQISKKSEFKMKKSPTIISKKNITKLTEMVDVTKKNKQTRKVLNEIPIIKQKTSGRGTMFKIPDDPVTKRLDYTSINFTNFVDIEKIFKDPQAGLEGLDIPDLIMFVRVLYNNLMTFSRISDRDHEYYWLYLETAVNAVMNLPNTPNDTELGDIRRDVQLFLKRKTTLKTPQCYYTIQL